MAKPLIPPIIYHDERNIYLEWPSYVQKLPFTEGGLSRALRMIPHIASLPGYVTGRSNIADKLIDNQAIKLKAKRDAKHSASLSEGQRRSASAAIRGLKPKVRA